MSVATSPGGYKCTKKITLARLACLWNNYYNIVFTLVLPNSYWAIMVEILICAGIVLAAKHLSSLAVSSFHCISAMWTSLWTIQTQLKTFDFCQSEMFTKTWVFWLCLHFHCNVCFWICLPIQYFSLQFVWRSEFFIDNFRNRPDEAFSLLNCDNFVVNQ